MLGKKFIISLISLLALFIIQLNLVVADDVYKVSNFIPKTGLKLLAEPKQNSKIIASIPQHTSWIKILGKPQAGWQKIIWNGLQGWVPVDTVELDRAATDITGEKVDCLHDPNVKNKMCCGIVEITDDPSELVKIYSVTGIAKGALLQMSSSPGQKENVISLLPHNATWIMKLGETITINGIKWEKIKWGGNTGWVDARKIQYSPELTSINDMKRKACNVPKGCDPDLSVLQKY